jgi:hypothetical protein
LQLVIVNIVVGDTDNLDGMIDGIDVGLMDGNCVGIVVGDNE